MILAITRENEKLIYEVCKENGFETPQVLTGVDKVLKEFRPDIVLVHGDTSTTLNGALAAFYNKVPVGHVEAGLRTYNLESPWPEEFNRQAVSIVSKFNFCPTELSKQNLLKEGKEEESRGTFQRD